MQHLVTPHTPLDRSQCTVYLIFFIKQILMMNNFNRIITKTSIDI